MSAGGGMVNHLESSPILTNVALINNSAGVGGGIVNRVSSSPTLTNVILIGNTAVNSGGGLYNSFDSEPRLTNVTFSGNSAEFGGGIYNDQASSPTLREVEFVGNSADSGGGMFNARSSSPSLSNVTFSGNTAADFGGGIYNSQSSPTLANVTLAGNSATIFGGGIYNSSSWPALTGVVLMGNTAGIHGGGLYNFGGSPRLTNVTLSNNSATVGGGLYNYDSDAVTTNSILWGNVADADSQIHDERSRTWVSYSIVQGGWSGSGEANLDADPLFVDAVEGDLRILPGSPAIDAGDNSFVQNDAADLDGDGITDEPTPLDLAGEARFFDVASVLDSGSGTSPIVDMGAYEHANNLPIASNQEVLSVEDASHPITLSATDLDGDQLTFHIVEGPAHGSLVDLDSANGTLRYWPAADSHGEDSFTFHVDDGSGDSNVATVTITVTPVPDVADDVRETRENPEVAISVLANDDFAVPTKSRCGV